ncbi:MAG TPA: helix-turn-helix domain-containing protein, partial [Xanthobacteraceae bacterium]
MMPAANDEFEIVHLCSDDVAEHNRLDVVRDVYGRAIVKHDIEAYPDVPFYWRSTLRILPGLGLAATALSGARTRRTAAQIDSDNLVLNIILAGKLIVRQFGREAVVDPGELVVTRSADVASCDVATDSRCVGIRLPLGAIAPTIADLDSILVRKIPAGTEPLSLLMSYVDVLQDTEALGRPDTRHLVVAHVHDLVALTLGATREAAETAKGRGVRAARLRAVKADIVAHIGSRDLSLETVAARQGISTNYVRKLFEGEGTNFTDFVLEQRIALVRRTLCDPRFADRPIGAIAYEAGFGDLSYFNRA